MGLFRYVHPLLKVPQAVASNEVGETFVIVPSDSDRTEDHQISFRAFIDATQSGGSSAPTVTVYLQTSHNGSSWVDAIVPIQLNADGTTNQFVAIQAVGPFVRAKTVLGGNPKPNHTVMVALAADGAFRLQAVPGSPESQVAVHTIPA